MHQELSSNKKSWIKYIEQRISKNKNFIGFIGGPTGSGKSWSTLSIAEQLDKRFDVDQIVFNGVELMKLINSGKLKKGSVIAFEETGVGLSSKNWQSTTNKMINFLIQTFRHQNFVLLLNSPYMDFVDASTRKLFHAEIMTRGIDNNTNECILMPRVIQYNQRTKKFYYKRLRVFVKKLSSVVPIDTWRVKRPSKDLIEKYEAKKIIFTTQLNMDIEAELESAFNKKRNKKRELSLRQQNVYDLLKEKYNSSKISAQLNISERMVRQIMQTIRSKGYKVEPVYAEDRTIRYYEV